jgi:hypothetical protein
VGAPEVEAGQRRVEAQRAREAHGVGAREPAAAQVHALHGVRLQRVQRQLALRQRQPPQRAVAPQLLARAGVLASVVATWSGRTEESACGEGNTSRCVRDEESDAPAPPPMAVDVKASSLRHIVSCVPNYQQSAGLQRRPFGVFAGRIKGLLPRPDQGSLTSTRSRVSYLDPIKGLLPRPPLPHPASRPSPSHPSAAMKKLRIVILRFGTS